MARRRKMTDEQIVTLLQNELFNSDGWDSDTLSTMRKEALDYYFGRARGDEVEGRSKVISMDVADMVEAVMAEIMPGIEIDDLATFKPEDEGDIEQAALESDAVNDMIMSSNDGYMTFVMAMHDALLMANGYIEVYIDEKIDQQTHEFIGIDPIGVDELVQVRDPETEIEILSSEVNDDDDTTLDVSVRITTTRKRLIVGPADATNVFVRADHDSYRLQGAGFVAKRDYPTRTELRREGYSKKVVDGLSTYTIDTKTDSTARNQGQRQRPLESDDPSQDKVERYTCYITMDKDNTGVGELYEAVMVDDTLLACEPFEMIPLCTGSPFPQPFRVRGLGLYDKLKQTQDIKTKGWRNWLDNQSLVNYSRAAVSAGVDLDAYTNPRPGGAVPCMDPRNDIVPIVTPDNGASIQASLEYADKARSERGGASLDLQNAEAQIAGETAWGVERQYSAREKLSGLMARNLAKTLVTQTFLLVHNAMRLYMRGGYSFQRGDEFVTVDPSTWRERKGVITKTGETLAQRNHKLATLREIYTEQKAMIAAGYDGIVTDESKTFACLVDMSRAAGIDDPHRYWINPASDKANQARKQKQAQGQQEQQAQQQQTEMLLSIQRDIERNKNATDLAVQQSKDRTAAFEAKLDAVVELVTKRAELAGKEGQMVVDFVARQAANETTEGNDDD